MSHYTLYIANRNYSSWSLRPWLLMTELRIPFTETLVPFEESNHANFSRFSPNARVPCLHDGDTVIWDSLAIIEYLDETHPEPALLPKDALGRAHVRALAQSIACEIHPINNLRVLKYLSGTLGLSEDQKNTWYRHWVRDGLEAFERQLAQGPESTYCFGHTPTLADCCLVPQIFNGKRFAVSFDGLPLTMAAFDACMKLEAFQKAQSSACPDAE